MKYEQEGKGQLKLEVEIRNEGITGRMTMEQKLKRKGLMKRQEHMKWWMEVSKSGEKYPDEPKQATEVQN